MRRTAALLIALLALAGLAGCGDDTDDVATGDGPGATQEPDLNDPLADRELTVTEATGHQIVDGTTITLSFDGANVNVEAGCNHLSGTYTWEDADADSAVLVIEALGGTEMGCDPERMEQDAWISAFLADRPTVTTTGGGAVFTLTAGTDVVTLSDEPVAEPASLVGPTWTLDTITERTDADGTASSLPAGVTATITFLDDGTYDLASGCNTGSGTYVEAGSGIYQLDDPSLTRRRCGEDAMGVEEVVVDVIDEGEVAISIEGERLTVTNSDGVALGFTASG